MIFKHSHIRFLTSAVVVGSLLLSACQDTSQPYSPRIASGSGSEVNLKESLSKTKLTDEQLRHVTDPTGLPAYKEYLKPVFEAAGADNTGVPLADLFKLKKWIIGPLDLKKMEAKALARSMSEEGEKKLLALHTQHEVWIDSQVYTKLDNKTAAQVLLKQYLISLYTLKNFDDEQLCTLAKEIALTTSCGADKTVSDEDALEDSSLFDTAEEKVTHKPARRGNDKNRQKNAEGKKENEEKEKANRQKANDAAKAKAMVLSGTDYKKIDAVAAYVVSAGDKLTSADLQKKLLEQGFDMRIFKMKSAGAANVEKVSGTQLEAMYKQMLELNKKKLSCIAMSSEKSISCEVGVSSTSEDVPEGVQAKKFLTIEFKEEDSEEAFASESVHQLNSLSMAKYKSTTSDNELYLLPLVSTGIKDRVVGKKFRMTYIVAVKAEGILKVEGLLSVAGEISKISQDKTAGTAGKIRCEAIGVESKDAKTDTVFVASSDKYAEALRKLTSKMIPTAPCW